jgi:D-alanyl-lipoteichoic acid acyltransferase DltB (MBOAT superfamily)
MSYVADIYLGRIRSEPNIAKVATYLVFFPKLIQGPIERAGSIMPQLKAPGIPDYGGLRSAAVLFGAGLFKKVVLGDRLAQVADPLFADPSQFGGMATVVATYAYAFQLYFDFSGYTDMARASARVLGIELSENFRTPYLASSLSDFWRRWHITFSRWLLEYVFSPLQAMWRRAPVTGTAAALLVTFVLSGAWHGFTGPFMVWGLLHGTYLAVESISRKIRGRRPPTYPLWQEVWGTVLTFNLVVVAWVFFRAPSLEVAWAVIRSVIEPTPRIGPLAQACGGLYALGITLAACSAYAFLVAVRSRTIYRNLMQHTVVRWALYFSLVTAVTFLRQGGAGFLYAQF